MTRALFQYASDDEGPLDTTRRTRPSQNPSCAVFIVGLLGLRPRKYSPITLFGELEPVPRRIGFAMRPPARFDESGGLPDSNDVIRVGNYRSRQVAV